MFSSINCLIRNKVLIAIMFYGLIIEFLNLDLSRSKLHSSDCNFQSQVQNFGLGDHRIEVASDNLRLWYPILCYQKA